MNIRYFFISFWPSLLTLGVVLYATLCPDPAMAHDLPAIPHLDKLIHAVMLGGLFGAIVFDIMRRQRREGLPAGISSRRLVFLALALMVFGVVDEALQALVTDTRSAEFLDLLADWTGIWVAFFTAPPAVRKVLRL